jgi:fructose-bisphosphate aldolase class 1
VAIVQPEVLMDGSYTIERCGQVRASFLTPCLMLSLSRVLEAMLLKATWSLQVTSAPVRPPCMKSRPRH